MGMNSYIFIGRLYPKPVNFNFPYFESSISSFRDHSKNDLLKIRIQDKLVNIELCSEFLYDEEELGVIKNSILYLVKGFLDAYGYFHHMAFNIDVEGVVLPDKRVFPLLAVPSKTETQDIPNITEKSILYHLHKSPSLNRLLVDYRNALTLPEDTGFFLYRTMEDIRGHFEKKHGLDKKLAWNKMNEELCLDPELVKSKVKPHGDGNRHGKLVTVSNQVGMELFILVRKIIDRFIIYIQSDEKKLEMEILK